MHVILPQNESTIVILSDFDRRDSEFVDGTGFALLVARLVKMLACSWTAVDSKFSKNLMREIEH